MNLDDYFPIRRALAADALDGVSDNATRLARSDDPKIAQASAALARAKDLATARERFGELSKAVIARVATSARPRESAVHAFECSMAKPYGRWLQETGEIGNPYYGSRMIRCGRRIEIP